MTDNEIIKALECCSSNGKCNECPYDSIGCEFEKDALDLINRQRAEIERLEKTKRLGDELIEQMRVTINNRTNENQQLRFDLEEQRIICKKLDRLFLKARAEAVKEFAERLLCTKFRLGNDDVIYAENINTIMKEMVGE